MRWGVTKSKQDSLLPDEVFRTELSRFFDDFFSMRSTSLLDSKWIPSIDLEEDEKSIRIKAEMPGVDEKDIDVTIERNMLKISGEKKEERREEGKKQVISERRYGSFSRSIQLPGDVDIKTVSAKFKNGVLQIKIAKPENAEPKQIKINSN